MRHCAIILVLGIATFTMTQARESASQDTCTWTIDTEQEWNDAKGEATHISLSGGFAKPDAEKSTFESIIKTFDERKKPQTITFKQSPVWDNWAQIEDITPKNVGNALVFLPVAPGDYEDVLAVGEN